MIQTNPISLSHSFEIDPIPSPPIENFDAQLIRKGTFDIAVSFSDFLRKQLEKGTATQEIVDLVLSQHTSVVRWIANQPYPAFHQAIAGSFYIKPLSKPVNDLLEEIHLAALAQRGKFTPFAVFYLLHRALQETPMEDRAIAEKLFAKYPKLPIYLRFTSLPDLQKKIDSFCFRSDDLSAVLETTYFAALENSPLFALASRFENQSNRQIQESLARATPEYWKKYLPTSFFEDLPQKKPEQAWKRLFQYFRKSAYFQGFTPQQESALMADLDALSKDITYFDQRHSEGQQVRILMQEARTGHNNTLLFPRCSEVFDELQNKLELCRTQFQPKLIAKEFRIQARDFYEILQAHKQFSSSFDASSFFEIFAKPIYAASTIYFFHTLVSSDMRSCPSKLCVAWKNSLAAHQMDPETLHSLEFKDYEPIVYDVWDFFSIDHPKCSLMSLTDLLKRKIEALDSDALCRLYEAMNKEAEQNRHTLLLFFSDDGKMRDIHWLLEGILS